MTRWDRFVSAWPVLRDVVLVGTGIWLANVNAHDPGPVDWGNVSIILGCFGIPVAARRDDRRAASPPEPVPAPPATVQRS